MPNRRGRVRRLAPRFGARHRSRRVHGAAVGVHQRPAPDPTRARPVHAPARPRRRARRRRHHHLVGRRRAVPRDAQRVEHRRPGRRAGRRRREHADGPFEATDVTPTRAVLAAQGPEARALLAEVLADAAAVPRFGVTAVTYPGGADGWAAGTGYTGEDGVELHVPALAASDVWHAVLSAGLTPAGLGARDTLRLEAGLPLHGHELGPGITPLQAGLGWVVRFDKGAFRGSEPLLAEQEHGVARLLRGLSVDGRQIPRAGCPVLVDGAAVGEVTSGNFSPMLEHGIALGVPAPRGRARRGGHRRHPRPRGRRDRGADPLRREALSVRANLWRLCHQPHLRKTRCAWEVTGEPGSWDRAPPASDTDRDPPR